MDTDKQVKIDYGSRGQAEWRRAKGEIIGIIVKYKNKKKCVNNIKKCVRPLTPQFSFRMSFYRNGHLYMQIFM